MTAGRPVGNHIRNICAVIEEIGPAGARDLQPHLPEIEASNMAKYCSRAVGLGMMTRAMAKRGEVKYSVFDVVPGWEVIAGQRRTPKLKPMPELFKSSWQGVNSVFSIAQGRAA